MLFLSQRSVYSDDKPFRMTMLDVIPGVHKIKGMDRKRESSIDKKIRGNMGAQKLPYPGTKAVSGDPVCPDAQINDLGQ